MHLIMVSRRRLLGAEQCWVVRWTLIETWLYYITGTDHSSHALADAVKSDVVHLVTACRAFLLPRCRAEQPVHAGRPTEIFDHACKHDSADCVRYHDMLISHYLALSATAEQLRQVSHYSPGTLRFLAPMKAKAHRRNPTLFALSRNAGLSYCSL